MKPTVTAIVIGCVLPLSWACGEKPARLGVTVDSLHIAKMAAAQAPADAPNREYASTNAYLREKHVNFLRDGSAESIVEMPNHHAVEVRDASGHAITQFTTHDYLTDFDVVSDPVTGTRNLVLYTYPNATRAGTFTVFDANHQQIAEWDVNPAIDRFAPGVWSGKAAVFYLSGNEVVAQDLAGSVLTRLDAPEGRIFGRIHVIWARSNLVVVGSGGGYTPYHMVAVYGPDGRLLYHEIADEHAFDLESRDDGSFIVVTRSTVWRYDLPSAP